MSIVGLEASSGVERQRLSTEKALDNGHHHRCYRNKATNNYVVLGRTGIALQYGEHVTGLQRSQ